MIIKFFLFLMLFSLTSCTKSNKLQIYIIAGQSNAVGYNDFNTYKPNFPYSLEQPDIMFWAGGSSVIDSLRDTWISLRVGISSIKGYENSFGPEISFGRYMADNNPDKKISIIKYAIGGTGIARSKDYKDYKPKGFENFDDKSQNWYPPIDGQPSGLIYKAFIENVYSALESLKRQNKKYELKGIIWIQGEHEAGLSPKMASDYESLLNNFIKHIRKDLASPNIPVLIGEVSNKWIYAKVVRRAQKNVSAKNSNVKTIIAKDLPRKPKDDSHYTAKGMVILGIRTAKALQELHTN